MAVIKSIELVGVSTESWRDAAQAALAEASKTLRGIEGMHVLTCERVKDNGLYLHWSQGRPYLVTGPERTRDGRK